MTMYVDIWDLFDRYTGPETPPVTVDSLFSDVEVVGDTLQKRGIIQIITSIIKHIISSLTGCK